MDLETLRRVANENRRHKQPIARLLGAAVAEPVVAEVGKPAPTLEERYDEIYKIVNEGSPPHRDPDYSPQRWTPTLTIGTAGPNTKLLMRFRWVAADRDPGAPTQANFLHAEFYEAPMELEPVDWVMEGGRGTLIAEERLYRAELHQDSVDRRPAPGVENYASPEARLARLEESLIYFTTARAFQQPPQARAAA